LAIVRKRRAQPIGWVASPTAQALTGLTRKLPHYGKYSYLAFAGEEPTNRLEGRWPVQDSILRVWLSDRRPDLVPPARSPLTAVID
jgi:hypothetical protein